MVMKDSSATQDQWHENINLLLVRRGRKQTAATLRVSSVDLSNIIAESNPCPVVRYRAAEAVKQEREKDKVLELIVALIEVHGRNKLRHTLGVHENTMRNWLKRRYKPTPDIIATIQRLYMDLEQ